MERKRARQPKKAGRVPKLPLILVDGSRIRQKIKRDYEKVCRDLQKTKAELERFEKKDTPAYSRWIHRQFGNLLTDLRETTRRIHELEQLFVEIEAEIFYSGASHGQAYARVLHRQKQAQQATEDFDETSSGRGGEEGGSHHSSAGGGPDSDDFFEFGTTKKPAQPAGGSATALGRLKEIYRALARRLHPDAQANMTPEKLEWWHQAQAAYEAGDLEQLETILTLREIEDTGTTEKTSLSLLQRISAQFRKTLRQLKYRLAASRREPAWDFTRREDLDELDAAMRGQLTHDLRLLQDQMRSMELHLAALSQPSPRRRSARARRGPLLDPFEFFF